MSRRRPYTRPKNGRLQLYVRVHPGPGGLKTTMRDHTVTPAEIEAWVTEQRAKYGRVPDVAGSLRAAVRAYLAGRTAMPTLEQHTYFLGLWITALGADRAPLSVTADEITRIVDRWMHDGLGNNTIRKRRGALRTFYNRAFPKHINPVKGSLQPKEPKVEARELTYPDIDAAIRSMPTYRSTKPGAPKERSLAKVVLRFMADTGFPPSVISQIEPKDFDWTARTISVASREKGEGVERRTLPLEAAYPAARAFDAAHAYGPYSDGRINAMGRSFKRACRRIGLPMRSVTQYILRHSFLSQYYRVTKDEATVQRVGLHAPGSRCTHRYTLAAHREIDQAAAKAFRRSLAELRRRAKRQPRHKLPKVARKRVA
jgi:integrase